MTSEEKVRLKLKLRLYGSYTREIERLEHRYFEIEQEMSANEDMRKVAKNLGVHSDDPYHPASVKLQLEYSSIADMIEKFTQERTYLGLDEWLESLSMMDYKIIMGVYIQNKTYDKISKDGDINYSKSSCHRRIEKIFKSWDTSL